MAAFRAIAVLLLTGVLACEDASHEHGTWTTFVWFAVLLMMVTELGELGVPWWFSDVVIDATGGAGRVPGS